LKGQKQFPEKRRPLEIEDEAENPDENRERGDIGPDSGDGLVSLLTQEIGRCRDYVSPRTQPGTEEIHGHNPVPENVYLSFHVRLLDLPVA
jgi:hypothetical protein